MRLIYISNARIPTGKAHGVQIMHMCNAFAEQGMEVELVVPSRRNFMNEDPFEHYGVKKNFTIRRLPVPDLASKTNRFPKFLFLLDMLMFALAILFTRVAAPHDIVYTRDYPLLLLFPPKRYKTVLELHTIHGKEGIFKRVIRRASLLVAITHGIKKELIELGIPGRKITVAPDAVDLSRFVSPESGIKARERLGLPGDKNIALYIGRFDGWKGSDTFFAASEFVSGGTLLAAIGGGDEPDEKLRKNYPLVAFLGMHPYREIADNQSAADVLVLPNSGKEAISARHTSPMKLFTYMASGKPIVSSDLPSIREVLDEGSAYLVAPDDAKALAQGIETALLNKKDAQEKARRALSLVENYTWSGRAKAILEAIK